MLKEAIEKQAIIACNARCYDFYHNADKFGNSGRRDNFFDYSKYYSIDARK